MKPPPFDYHDPATVEETLSLLAELEDSATILAGGQSLIPLLNMRLASPAALIDLRKVGLDHWRKEPAEIRVEAMVRAATLERDPGVASAIPGLMSALRCVGHPQIRNRTTVGGNLAHADPASEVPAVLTGLGGTITLRSAARGERKLAADDFFLGVFFTARQPDELVTEISFPAFPGPSTFLEVARRPGDFAIAGAFLALAVEGGAVADVRIALSGVADRPIRSGDGESAVRGERPTTEAISRAARAVSASVSPNSDIHGTGTYRAALAGVLVERGLTELAREVGSPG